MKKIAGTSAQSLLLVHGGAGPQDPSNSWIDAATKELIEIAQKSIAQFRGDSPEIDVVTAALLGMEESTNFNAGYGSALQADGGIRMTAALMNGKRQSFSGVIGVEHLRHPSLIAKELQDRSSRVLASPGCQLIARQLALPVENLLAPRRVEKWLKGREELSWQFDTVGAVAWNSPKGTLGAATSTGGRGGEYPGRVSDSGTVAGNYASEYAAISCTGIGEQIVDDALAARLETRCRDGLCLDDAATRCLTEADKLNRSYGFIACSKEGDWVVGYTTKAMTYVVITDQGEIIASSLKG